MSLPMGIMIGATVILLYTMFGTMLSVARTGLLQIAIIVAGMIYIGFIVAEFVGSNARVANHTLAMREFSISSALTPKDISAFIAAGVTMMFGSIVRQDVFQRVISAKNKDIIAAGSIINTLIASHHRIPTLCSSAALTLVRLAVQIKPSKLNKWKLSKPLGLQLFPADKNSYFN
jgi:Na+/proline symporter